MSVSISGAGSISGLDQGFNVTTGSVGVGTTNPRTDLQVGAFGGGDSNIQLATGTSGASNILFGDSSAGSDYYKGFIKYNHSTDNLELYTTDDLIHYTGGSERLRITSDGKLLIGSDTGSVHGNRLLQVGKTDRSETYVSIVSSTSGESGLLFADTTTNDTGGYRGQIRYHHSDDSMNFRTGAAERVRITSDGKVGINESSPDQALHVKGTSGDTVPARFESTGAQSRIGFKASGTPSSYHVACGAEANDFIVYTNNTEKLRITSAGVVKVGSNTLITPSTDADNFVIDTGDVDSGISILSATTGRIYFGDAASNDQGSIRYVHTDNSMRFETNSTEKLRITSDGRVCINATSPVLVGGQTPYLYVSSYTNLDGLRIRGLDTGNTIWKTGGDMSLTVSSNNTINLKTNSATRLSVNGNGQVTMPNQPSFHATNTTIGQINTDLYGTIVFNDVTNSGNHNIGSHYNTSNGRFTAPIAGRYLICARSLTNSAANSNPYVAIFVRINGNIIGYLGHNHTDSWIMESYSGILSLSANDYVDIFVNQASAHGAQNYSSFSGHLLS